VLVVSAVWHVDHLSPVTSRPALRRPVAVPVAAASGATPDPAAAFWEAAATTSVATSVASTSAPSPASGAGNPPAVGDDRPFLAPRLEALCHVAMCIAMGYMLVLML